MSCATYIAYKVLCITTGKVYIGITTQTIKTRWKQHTHSSKVYDTKFYRHICKYGLINFSIEEIASCRNLDDLIEVERILIHQWDSHRNGLNSTIGGDGIFGYSHSDSSRKKMSIDRKAIWGKEEYRKLITNSQRVAWANKSQEQLDKHKEIARVTMRKTALSRIRPKKEKEKQYKGKGWNMKIKTHCPSGHEYTTENTRINTNGSRVCVTCRRKNSNAARDSRRAEARSSATKSIFNSTEVATC